MQTSLVDILKTAQAASLVGEDGDDAKQYQEKQVKRAIEEVQK